MDRLFKGKLEFQNKVILAPMVRVGTLPMRLLALEYGADIVYSEEIIDLKLITCKRNTNEILGTIDFIDPTDGSVVFRTCNKEKGRVVLQLGTSSMQRALAVSKLIENDVAAVDINMGCPKEFSVKGGMGVVLLGQIEKAKQILKTLVDNLNIPVTCKIRLLPTIQETISIVKEFASTGIAAIAIHARTKEERPRHDPHPDFIRAVVETVNIPVIANGGSKKIETYSDILKFREQCGTSSVMVARAAQTNVSVFKKEGNLPIDDVITKYLKLCIEYDNSPSNTKYCVQHMIKDQQETPRGKIFLNCQTLHQICNIWNLGDLCYQKQLEYQEKGNFGRRDVVPGLISMRKSFFDKETEILENNIVFYRSNYIKDPELPKSMLYLYAKQNKLEIPKYETIQEDKLFTSILSFNGNKYTSKFWEKNKKYAEQGAALVCALHIGLVAKETLIKNGSILM